jgi:outer membrane protein, heavy metal efflux system
MRSSQVIPFVVLAFTLGAASYAGAQGVGPPGANLSVRAAIELAMEQNPGLNALRQEVVVRQGERHTALGIHAPQLVYFREGIATGEAGYQEQRWAISQTIDSPASTYYRLRQLGAEQEALVMTIQGHMAQLAAGVKKAYTDVLHAHEIVYLRKQEVQLSTELLRAVDVRLEAGEASGLDRIKAELELADAESNLDEADRAAEVARYALLQLVGLESDGSHYAIRFPDTLTYVPVQIAREEALRRIDRQPELAAASERLQGARLGESRVRGQLFPDLQVDYYPQDFGRGYRAYGFQIGLRLPRWFMLDHRGRMQMARAATRREEWLREEIERGLRADIEKAWHSYETTRRTIERFRSIVQARADELLRLTRQGYLMGEIDLILLLDTQRTYLSSQKRYFDALRDYTHHLIDLERFLGRELVFSTSGS